MPRQAREPNALADARAHTDEEAQAVLARYLAQEEAYYTENFFPDELDEMEASDTYAFHYYDYRYTNEVNLEDSAAEKSYRQRHDSESATRTDDGEGDSA